MKQKLTVNRRHHTDNHLMSRSRLPIGRRRMMSEWSWAFSTGGSLWMTRNRRHFNSANFSCVRAYDKWKTVLLMQQSFFIKHQIKIFMETEKS